MGLQEYLLLYEQLELLFRDYLDDVLATRILGLYEPAFRVRPLADHLYLLVEFGHLLPVHRVDWLLDPLLFLLFHHTIIKHNGVIIRFWAFDWVASQAKWFWEAAGKSGIRTQIVWQL